MRLPYFSLLTDSLRHKGFYVKISPQFPRRGIIFGKKFTAIHLHMLDHIFLGKTAFETARRIFMFFLVIVPAARLRGIRIVWTCHELTAHEGDAHNVTGRLTRVVCRIACRIIVHNGALRRELLEYCPQIRGKLITLPHGDLRPFYDHYLKAGTLRCKTQNFVFVSIGYMRPNKGNDVIIRAFRRLRDPAARLVMTGNCNNLEFQRMLQDLAAMDSRISLDVRNLTDQEVVALHQAADVAVFAFRQCPTSGSVLTALALGTPAIAPRIGHVGELVDESIGWTYAPETGEEGLLLAMLDATRDHSLSALKGKRAEQSVADQNWNDIAHMMGKIYRGDYMATRERCK